MKVLVFAGTKNGRLLIESLGIKDVNVYASVISQHGANLIGKHPRIQCLIGKMDVYDIIELCEEEGIDIIIDSTHPYAREISLNILKACEFLNVRCIRFERQSSIAANEGLHFSNFEKLFEFLDGNEGNVLFTTGINNLGQIVKHLSLDRVFLRCVPMKTSYDTVKQYQIPKSQFIFKQPPFTLEDNLENIKNNNIKYIVTKDSGNEGNTKEKVMAAKILNSQLLVIDRPIVEYPEIYFSLQDVMEEVDKFS